MEDSETISYHFSYQLWAKRFLKSESKWTIFPRDMELEKAFSFGPDYLERTEETSLNPFWLVVISSLQTLQSTPLWFNQNLKLLLNPIFHTQGSMVLGDVMDGNFNFLPLDEIQFHKKPLSSEALLRNSSLNLLLNFRVCTCNLHKMLLVSKKNILEEICDEWRDKCGLVLETQNVSRSFIWKQQH